MSNQDRKADGKNPPAVQPLGDRDPEALRAAAAGDGMRYVQVRFNAGADKKAVLRAIATALQFPQWFGANLDALYDCLTDLPDGAQSTPGWLIVLDGLPRAPHLDADTRTALLDVFRDAADDFAARGLALRVYYR